MNSKFQINELINHKKISIFFIFVSCFIIFISLTYSAFNIYHLHDFMFATHAHNSNISKKIFEVHPNIGNIHGITTWILSPSFNFLSNFNYNILNSYDYKIYLGIFRFLEIITLLIFLYTFAKKIKINDVLIIFFFYILTLVNFHRYDHESYINFPIIVFYLSHLIAHKIKNDYFFFFIIFLGNLWAYIINPIYFFVVCFFPLIYFYSYHLYNKNYKKFFLILIANIPFAIMFILISLGTSRFALSELYTGQLTVYNFTIINSKNFQLISILLSILAIRNFVLFRQFDSLFFLFFLSFSLILGLIFNNDPENWKFPPPNQFEYAIQYILIFIFYKIFKETNKDFLKLIIIGTLSTLFIFRSYFFFQKHIELEELYSKKNEINNEKIYDNTFFWSETTEKFFFRNELKNKKVFINIPNLRSDFHKSSKNEDLDNLFYLDRFAFKYNKNIDGSFWYPYFWNNNIIINSGYSHYLDINTVLANFFNPGKRKYYEKKYNKYFFVNTADNRLLKYQVVPQFGIEKKLLFFYNFDYILSDVILSKLKNDSLEIEKVYNFKSFNLYLYRIKENLRSFEIKKINIIENTSNYTENIKNFQNELFVTNENLKKIKNIKNFCQVKRLNNNNLIIFDVKKNDNLNCLAIFPIPFSYNNNFEFSKKFSTKKIKCDTFKVQFYFHGCIFNNNQKIIFRKNNLFLYSIGSIRDYLEYKKINSL